MQTIEITKDNKGNCKACGFPLYLHAYGTREDAMTNAMLKYPWKCSVPPRNTIITVQYLCTMQLTCNSNRFSEETVLTWREASSDKNAWGVTPTGYLGEKCEYADNSMVTPQLATRAKRRNNRNALRRASR